MGRFDDLVIFTTTKYGEDATSQVRAQLALRLFENAQNMGIRTFVTDGGSTQAFLDKLKDFPLVTVLVAPGYNMGGSRRAGLYDALQVPKAKYFLWVEPEKFGLITEKNLLAMITPLRNNEALIVIPKRKHKSSYPKFQALTETCANLRITELMYLYGQDQKEWNGTEEIDFMFGPKIFCRGEANRFYTYTSDPDTWDSTIVPVLNAYRYTEMVLSVPVDFTYDESQRLNEEGDFTFTKKRLEQYRVVLNACEAAVATRC